MFLKKLFNKGNDDKKREETLFAPLTGRIVLLEDVPDPVFSQKMMGDGIAIDPTDGTVVSPVNGQIVQFFPTKHAIGILSETGTEILIHVGLETVSMNGEGFEGLVNVGDNVTVGTPLLNFNLQLVREKAKSTITPVILTNGEHVASFEKYDVLDAIQANTELASISVKE
ncbi:PTS glucose transporter subunit IIA [Bacillus timonensis]|nr:PTS glucose transporter subunit IIA [Bacillus timonensis]